MQLDVSKSLVIRDLDRDATCFYSVPIPKRYSAVRNLDQIIFLLRLMDTLDVSRCSRALGLSGHRCNYPRVNTDPPCRLSDQVSGVTNTFKNPGPIDASCYDCLLPISSSCLPLVLQVRQAGRRA